VGSGSDFKTALRSHQVNVQLRLFATLDLHLDSNALKDGGQFLGVVVCHGEVFGVTACGSIDGGMDGLKAPFDKKWKHSVVVIGEFKSFQVQDAAVGSLTRIERQMPVRQVLVVDVTPRFFSSVRHAKITRTRGCPDLAREIRVTG
jgi:hypothetical protein